MTQKEHIEYLLKRSEIQKLYSLYIEKQEEEYLERILQLMDQIYAKKVKSILYTYGCHTRENEEDILQEIRYALIKNIHKDSVQRYVRPNVVQYSSSVYKNKTFDFIREYCSGKKNIDADGFVPLFDNNQNSIAEISAAVDGPEIIFDKNEKAALYREVFKLYCRSLVDSHAFPPSCLALYYARILPHLLAAVKHTKMASAKWAMKYMDKRTIDFLSKDSESALQKNIDPVLRWCHSFIVQLDNTIDSSSGKILLKNLIYTDEYSREKTEDWSENMNRAMLKDTNKKIKEDKILNAKIKEYASMGDRLLKHLD